MDNPQQRVTDQNVPAQTAQAIKITSSTFWDWIERRKIAAHAVIGITLWLTIGVIEWALEFANNNVTRDSNSVGIIIGAVLTPWGLMQSAMFKFYIDLMKSNGAPQ